MAQVIDLVKDGGVHSYDVEQAMQILDAGLRPGLDRRSESDLLEPSINGNKVEFNDFDTADDLVFSAWAWMRELYGVAYIDFTDLDSGDYYIYLDRNEVGPANNLRYGGWLKAQITTPPDVRKYLVLCDVHWDKPGATLSGLTDLRGTRWGFIKLDDLAQGARDTILVGEKLIVEDDLEVQGASDLQDDVGIASGKEIQFADGLNINGADIGTGTPAADTLYKDMIPRVKGRFWRTTGPTPHIEGVNISSVDWTSYPGQIIVTLKTALPDHIKVVTNAYYATAVPLAHEALPSDAQKVDSTHIDIRCEPGAYTQDVYLVLLEV